MEITDVQVKLIGDGNDRLKASCTIAIDGEFVIRDVKVIEGTSGLFVAMPSRKLTDHCPKCGHKNHLRSRYCNHCGARLSDERWTTRGSATQLHAEIAHPINRDCREHLHTRVIEAYEAARQERGRDEESAADDAVEKDADRGTDSTEPNMAQEPVAVDSGGGDGHAEVDMPAPQADRGTPANSPSDSGVPSVRESDETDSFGAGLR